MTMRMLETNDDRVVFYDGKELGLATKSRTDPDGSKTMVLSVYMNLAANKGNESLISIFESALAVLKS